VFHDRDARLACTAGGEEGMATENLPPGLALPNPRRGIPFADRTPITLKRRETW